jgi:very-short-patch-repair endonuclease
LKNRQQEAEETLWNALKGKQLGVAFERGRKFGKYRLFYSATVRLAFDVWDETEPPRPDTDIFAADDKAHILAKQGIRYFAVSAGDVLDNADEVVLRIIDRMNG